MSPSPQLSQALASVTWFEGLATLLFVVAIVHTFAAPAFQRLACRESRHSGVWHLLGEVEVVFGLWAMVLMVLMALAYGKHATINYLETRDFTEPIFVFAIMVVAGTRPILQMTSRGVSGLAALLHLPGSLGLYVVVMAVVPLLGSFITEPAAMTLAALILADKFFSQDISSRLKYLTLATLFVNVSIGGTLTSYAAPPVLMVAGTWGWNSAFMLATFGWKAALIVAINTGALALYFRRELSHLPLRSSDCPAPVVPLALVLAHLAFLIAMVVFSHSLEVFMGLFLFFLGLVQAYPAYQGRLILREGLLVAFFLSGLVVLGGQQQWWLQPLLLNMSDTQVFYGAVALTAVTDNAALTYLGSLVEGLSDSFKYALVAGAVSGGGLTIIANAPNPAGNAILKGYFYAQTVHPFKLLLAALAPTMVAVLVFRW